MKKLHGGSSNDNFSFPDELKDYWNYTLSEDFSDISLKQHIKKEILFVLFNPTNKKFYIFKYDRTNATKLFISESDSLNDSISLNDGISINRTPNCIVLGSNFYGIIEKLLLKTFITTQESDIIFFNNGQIGVEFTYKIDRSKTKDRNDEFIITKSQEIYTIITTLSKTKKLEIIKGGNIFKPKYTPDEEKQFNFLISLLMEFNGKIVCRKNYSPQAGISLPSLPSPANLVSSLGKKGTETIGNIAGTVNEGLDSLVNSLTKPPKITKIEKQSKKKQTAERPKSKKLPVAGSEREYIFNELAETRRILESLQSLLIP